ncbi:helix-turn-helix domain-containing protein [Paenibacillus polymyxa]|uniref:helix-turn-helix domain-containing protein n=1 Tax=Paenibacillus polymyxa TaxID=1406 RepID=UPI000A7E3F63|nr:helix-turn-helix domain-containing protein [Paenibacillus polymyxa]
MKSRGFIFYARKKGTKFNQYTFETKVEAIRLLEEGRTHLRLMEKFGIADRQLLKEWMRKYKKIGEFGLMDQRGRR